MPAGEASCNGTSPPSAGHGQPVIAPQDRRERSAGTDHPTPRPGSRIPHTGRLHAYTARTENDGTGTPPCVSPLEVPCTSFPAPTPPTAPVTASVNALATAPVTASVTTRSATGIPREMSVPPPSRPMRMSTTSCVARGPCRRTRRCGPWPGRSPAVRPSRRPPHGLKRRASPCSPQRPKRPSGRSPPPRPKRLAGRSPPPRPKGLSSPSPPQRPKRLPGQSRPHRPKRLASRGLALRIPSRCSRPAPWPRLLLTSTARRSAEMARDPAVVVPAAAAPGTRK